MKLVLLVLALVGFVVAHWTPETIKQKLSSIVECSRQYPLSAEVANKVSNNEFPNDEQVRKYLLCKAVKEGYFTRGEGFNFGRIEIKYKGCISQNRDEVQAVYDFYVCGANK